MNKLSRQIGTILTDKKLTISTCESCTGGMLGSIITKTPGSSTYFLGGITAYSNDVKQRIVGVQAHTLKKYGAVSAAVAEEMSSRVRRRLKTDIGLSITGIAGPTGGTTKKPVGLVFISIADKKNIITKRFVFKGTREHIRRRACREALLLLRRSL